jgi:hypothetical protein
MSHISQDEEEEEKEGKGWILIKENQVTADVSC